MSRKWMWLLVAGAGAWWLIQRQREAAAQSAAMVSAAMMPRPMLPTDTMMPGAIDAAVQGIIKEGEGLSCMTCG